MPINAEQASTDRGSSTSPEDAYSTRLQLPREVTDTLGQGPEDVIMHHRSMAAVLSYLALNNLIPGVPRPWTPFTEILHTDGRPLSEEEMLFLTDRGRDILGYLDEAGANEPFRQKYVVIPITAEQEGQLVELYTMIGSLSKTDVELMRNRSPDDIPMEVVLVENILGFTGLTDVEVREIRSRITISILKKLNRTTKGPMD